MATEYTKKIVLENGREFYGYGFGADVQSVNEIVFNTSMVGYQEMISDPSCIGQMVVMTYPVIGNYGVTDEDYEASILPLGALVVREYNDRPSNFRYTKTVGEVLEENGIPGIQGVDTRALTRIIRSEGSQKAMICDADLPLEQAMQIIRDTELPRDLVSKVSCKKRRYSRTANPNFDVVAIDCGIKYSAIRMLNERGCNVTIVPYTTTAEEVLALRADGLFLSSGPGNPQELPQVVELIRNLKGKMPIFGVDLGHLLVGLAYGAKTEKMKLGHHGSNHPVRNLQTGKIEIASQNHSYVVNADSLANTDLTLTHVDVLDGTVEGVKCEADRLFSVQFHPESEPAPKGSVHLFDQFLQMMKQDKEEKKHG